jgi:hypothetical protein
VRYPYEAPPGKIKNENAWPFESMKSGLLNRHFHEISFGGSVFERYNWYPIPD